MTDKKTGVLEIDELSEGIHSMMIDTKSKRLNLKRKEVSHLGFINYLKSTCRQQDERLHEKKLTCKQYTQPDSQQHQQLILTMRTQYEARPNS